MEENKYEAALERAKSAIKECGDNVGRIKMIESIFPELAESKEENIRKSILMMFKKALPDVFNRYGMNKNDAIAYMEKLKDIDKKLEDAYKTADEVQYNRGYQDAMDEKAKFVDAITDFPTEFEKQVSCFAASIINKEYDYDYSFIKWAAKGLLGYAKHELEKQNELTHKEDNMTKTSEQFNEKDEKIRKKLIEYFKDLMGGWFPYSNEEIIAYLEKVKNFDEQLEQAYKTADEVQYKRGYEYGREDYHAQALLYVLHKGVEQGEKEMLENALDAYCKVCSNYWSPTPLNICRQECKNYSDFKKAMEDKEL